MVAVGRFCLLEGMDFISRIAIGKRLTWQCHNHLHENTAFWAKNRYYGTTHKPRSICTKNTRLEVPRMCCAGWYRSKMHLFLHLILGPSVDLHRYWSIFRQDQFLDLSQVMDDLKRQAVLLTAIFTIGQFGSFLAIWLGDRVWCVAGKAVHTGCVDDCGDGLVTGEWLDIETVNKLIRYLGWHISKRLLLMYYWRNVVLHSWGLIDYTLTKFK